MISSSRRLSRSASAPLLQLQGETAAILPAARRDGFFKAMP